MKRMPPLTFLGRGLSARLALFTLVFAVIGWSLAPGSAAAGTRLARSQQSASADKTNDGDHHGDDEDEDGDDDDDDGDDDDGDASCETVIVRHAPQISGTVDGTIRQLLPESTSISGSGVVTGDLLIPGSPTVRLNGHPDYDGTLDEAGAASPTSHRVTLNGNAQLRHTIRRVDAIPMPTVAAPTAPTGVLDVTFTNPSQTVGSWADVRNLTLSGQADVRAVPPGSYGTFRANAGTGFILGIAGSTTPTAYSFTSLVLSGQSALQVVGPVVVTLGTGLTLNASAGNADHAEWFTLNVANGGVTLNGGSSLSAVVTAPNGTVTVNGNSQLCGRVTADRLRVNGNGVVVCCISDDEQPPVDPPGPTPIFPYQSPWKYMIFPDMGAVPADWYAVNFDDSAWPVANGAFASGGYCDLQATGQTDWPINSDIVIRRTFTLPAGVITLRISGTVDNDVQIYLNGNLITDWISHDGCAQPDDVSFTAPVGTYHTGTNLLTIRARDRGDQSFVDYRVSIND